MENVSNMVEQLKDIIENLRENESVVVIKVDCGFVIRCVKEYFVRESDNGASQG